MIYIASLISNQYYKQLCDLKNSLHVFQGTTNPTYQPILPGTGSAVPLTSHTGSVPGHKMSQVVAPTPPPQGFMPVNSGVVQRPGIGQMQPPSPTQAASAQTTVTPAAPPPTVQTVDTSNVPGKFLDTHTYLHLYIYVFPLICLFIIRVLKI